MSNSLSRSERGAVHFFAGFGVILVGVVAGMTQDDRGLLVLISTTALVIGVAFFLRASVYVLKFTKKTYHPQRAWTYFAMTLWFGLGIWYQLNSAPFSLPLGDQALYVSLSALACGFFYSGWKMFYHYLNFLRERNERILEMKDGLA